MHLVLPPNETEAKQSTGEATTVEEPVNQADQPHYPSRNRQPPSYLEEYDCTDSPAPSDTDDYFNYIDYCYMLSAPKSCGEAANCNDSEHWKAAMDEEIKSIRNNYSFTVTDLPEGKIPVGRRWVYALKADPKNPIYKARYVTKGYSQIAGIDYGETFSPTARMESVRSLMQIAIQYDLILHQINVKSAYLHAPINQEIYVNQPAGYSTANRVWKLNKSLYGLKQSGRNWHQTLHDYLMKLGFNKSTADPCIFFKRDGKDVTILLVWIDDIFVATSTINLMSDIKSKLLRNLVRRTLEACRHS